MTDHVENTPKSDKYNFIKQAILVVVLLAVTAVGIYEYAFARPAYNKIVAAMNEVASDPSGLNLTDIQIHEKLDREPTAFEEINGGRIRLEKYLVTRVAPLPSFELYIWYTKNLTRWQYTGHRSNRPDDIDMRPVGGRIQISDGKDKNGNNLRIAIGGMGQPQVSQFEVPTEGNENGELDVDSSDATSSNDENGSPMKRLGPPEEKPKSDESKEDNKSEDSTNGPQSADDSE